METDKNLVQDLLNSVPEYIQKVQDQTDEKTLPFKCAVTTCSNAFETYKKHLKAPFKFHNFPSDKFPFDQPQNSKKWLIACGLSSSNRDLKNLKVCSDHFDLDDYIRNYKEEIFNPKFKRKLYDAAVPHIKVANSELGSKKSSRIKIVSYETKTNKVPSAAFANDIYENQTDKDNKSTISKNTDLGEKSSQEKQVEKSEKIYIKTEIELGAEITESSPPKARNNRKRRRGEITDDILDKQKYQLPEDSEDSSINDTLDGDELSMLKKRKRQLEKDINTLKQKIKCSRQAANYKKKKLQSIKAKGFKNEVYKLVKEGVFTRAQLMFLLGRKKVIWSDDDYASAFALRHYAGKEAYLYMKNELRWPLPSLRSVQIWAASD